MMSKTFKTIGFVLVGWCVNTSILVAQTQPSTQPGSQPVTPKSFTELIPPEKLKDDLDFLFKTIEQTHPNMYAYIDEAEFSKLKNSLYARADSAMNRKQLYWLLAPVIAGLKSGHTQVLPLVDELMTSLGAGGKVYALTLDCTHEPPVLVDYAGASALPVGGTVLSINHEEADKMIARYAGCMASEGNRSNRPVLARLLPVLLWLDYGTDKPLALTIRAIDGAEGDYTVEPVTLKEVRESRESKKSQGDYSYRYLSDHGAAIIEWKSFGDRQKFQGFLGGAFKDIQDKKASCVIIDLRENPGGNSELGQDMMDYLYDKPYTQFTRIDIKISPLLRQQQPWSIDLAKSVLKGREPNDGEVVSIPTDISPVEVRPSENPFRYKGQVYVLIGPKTGSSAVMFASMAKYYHIATLVGEETGDTTVCYGDTLHFNLPNSKLQIGVACKYFVNVGGKPDGHGVIPDYEVKQTRKHTAKGVDTVLQFTLNLIKSNPLQPKTHPTSQPSGAQ
jgi:hypothetical protein